MKNNPVEIAHRIAGLREDGGYTPEEMAAELGIDTALYLEYERTGEDVPINVIFHLANIFKVDFNEILTGNSGKLDSCQIVRAGHGKHIERYDGYDYQDLAFRYGHKIMQPLIVTLQPTDAMPAPIMHAGQEFNYCISGTVILRYGEREHTLHQGDCAYFNSTVLHSQRCGGDVPGVFLVVIAEPL